MKKFLIAAIATTLVASPILTAAPAAAQNHRTEETTVRQKPNGTVVVKKQTVERQNGRQTYRTNWRKGERFDRGQARDYRQVTNWSQNRRLYAPHRGQQWVQSGKDAVLISVASGVVGAVIAGAFN